MQINLQGKNMEMTDDIRDYVIKRVTNLEKLVKNIEAEGGEVTARFEVSKTTNHHKAGFFFHADCMLVVKGEEFFSSADEQDVYTAIDAVKESLYMEVNKYKDRRQTLLHRGARSVKKMMKGLSKRNPFTSKY